MGSVVHTLIKYKNEVYQVKAVRASFKAKGRDVCEGMLNLQKHHPSQGVLRPKIVDSQKSCTLKT